MYDPYMSNFIVFDNSNNLGGTRPTSSFFGTRPSSVVLPIQPIKSKHSRYKCFN